MEERHRDRIGSHLLGRCCQVCMKLQSWGMRGRRRLLGAHGGWGSQEGLDKGGFKC